MKKNSEELQFKVKKEIHNTAIETIEYNLKNVQEPEKDRHARVKKIMLESKNINKQNLSKNKNVGYTKSGYNKTCF